MNTDLSLRRRLIVIDLMVPTLVIFSLIGGWLFALLVAVILGMAAWELWRIFFKGGYSPSLILMVLFSVSGAILRHFFEFQYSGLWFSMLILAAMLYHTLMYQKGKKNATLDFMITVGGTAYLGWLGSYAVSIRDLSLGLYWVFLIFPIISLADSGAYIFGRLLGRHKMLPLVSPKKSWEGYLGGIIIGTLGGWGLAALWHISQADILPFYGVILGFVISVLAPFGDFGESMIKRQFNVKDSGLILSEHGGILDRADSSLWAAAIGYYLITFIIR